jgi:hypothetical protein
MLSWSSSSRPSHLERAPDQGPLAQVPRGTTHRQYVQSVARRDGTWTALQVLLAQADAEGKVAWRRPCRQEVPPP